MFKYYSCLLLSSILATTTLAIPNYFDPRNIINAHDPFWSFGLTKEGIMQLQKFPAARKELWGKISKHTHDFRKYAMQRITDQPTMNEDDRNLYKQAIAIIDGAEQEARTILFPVGLSSTEIDKLNNIIDGRTPEKVLQFDAHSKKLLQQLKRPRMGGSRFQEQVPVRVDLEKNYEELSTFLKSLTARAQLSRKNRALIARAQESLENAYKALHQYVNFA